MVSLLFKVKTEFKSEFLSFFLRKSIPFSRQWMLSVVEDALMPSLLFGNGVQRGRVCLAFSVSMA